MKVWVKEYDNILTAEMIRIWIRSNIEVLTFRGYQYMSEDDLLIVTISDLSVEKEKFYLYRIVQYEEIFTKLTKAIIEECEYNYDYYYLKNTLQAAREPNIHTLFTGSSYGLFGIDNKIMGTSANLSLISQDLYYSLKGIYDVVENNSNIKNIVLCVGYYYFFSDLSRAGNKNEIMRITRVYNRIFGDMHNCCLLPPFQSMLPQSSIFDVENVMDLWAISKCCNGYFNEGKLRKNSATKEWMDTSKNWIDLSKNEKRMAGKIRAEKHNKGILRKGTFEENKKNIFRILQFLYGTRY